MERTVTFLLHVYLNIANFRFFFFFSVGNKNIPNNNIVKWFLEIIKSIYKRVLIITRCLGPDRIQLKKLEKVKFNELINKINLY